MESTLKDIKAELTTLGFDCSRLEKVKDFIPDSGMILHNLLRDTSFSQKKITGFLISTLDVC